MIGRGPGIRVLGYVRVSTDEQAGSGVSLDAQRHRLAAYAAAHDLELVGIEADEGISARRMGNRPALQRVLERLRRGEAAAIVVLKLDRLSRTTRDLLDLVARSQKEGWGLHSLHEHLDSSSATGRFALTLLGALAQLEREQVGERTRMAMGELRRQGRRTSSKPPFGYRFEGDRVVEVPAEQRILARIAALRAEGLGCCRLKSALDHEFGGNPRTGKHWNLGTLRAVLRSAARRNATP